MNEDIVQTRPIEYNSVSDTGLPFLFASVGNDPLGDYESFSSIGDRRKLGDDEESEGGKRFCEHFCFCCACWSLLAGAVIWLLLTEN